MKTARRAAALLSLGSLPALLAAAPPPPPAPPGSIPVAGPPTGVVSTDGGERVLVGFEGKFALNGGIALYRRSGTAFAPVASARTASAVQGLALSPDGRTVVATTRLGLAALDASALTAGTAKVLETRLGPAADANQIVWSRDGEHVFFTVQRYAELDVARVTPANPGGVPSVEVTGKIPLDRLGARRQDAVRDQRDRHGRCENRTRCVRPTTRPCQVRRESRAQRRAQRGRRTEGERRSGARRGCADRRRLRTDARRPLPGRYGGLGFRAR